MFGIRDRLDSEGFFNSALQLGELFDSYRHLARNGGVGEKFIVGEKKRKNGT